MKGRADIEESKNNVALNARLPQASYPYGNFSDTSTCNFRKRKGSIGHNFLARIRTENQRQTSFSPFGLHEISVLIELILGHLRYRVPGGVSISPPSSAVSQNLSPGHLLGNQVLAKSKPITTRG